MECRCRHASKEAAILICQLKSLPTDFFVYFGNLSVLADLTQDNHRLCRSRFTANILCWGKQHRCIVKLTATSEIADDLRIHYHYCIYSNRPIGAAAVKEMWSNACGGKKNIVHHAQPRKGIRAAAKYMHKDLRAVREQRQFIRLFDKKTLPITWGSRKFFAPNKQTLWREIVKDWKGDEWQDWREAYQRRRQTLLIEHAQRLLAQRKRQQVAKANKENDTPAALATKMSTPITASIAPVYRQNDITLLARPPPGKQNWSLAW